MASHFFQLNSNRRFPKYEELAVSESRHSFQFNLRSVFYITTLVAILAATCSPFLRLLKPGQQLLLIGLTILQAFCFVAGIAYVRYQRVAVRREAGRCTLSTSFFGRKRTIWKRELFDIAKLSGIAAIQIGIVVFVFFFVGPMKIREPWPFIYFVLFLQLHFTGYLAPRLFWTLVWGVDSNDIEVCENGIIHGALNFLPRDQIVEVRPSEFFDSNIVVVYYDNARQRLRGMPGDSTKYTRQFFAEPDQQQPIIAEANKYRQTI